MNERKLDHQYSIFLGSTFLLSEVPVAYLQFRRSFILDMNIPIMTFAHHSFCNKHFTFINKTPAKKKLYQMFHVKHSFWSKTQESNIQIVNILWSIFNFTWLGIFTFRSTCGSLTIQTIIHSGYRHIYNHFHFTFRGKYFPSVKFTLFNKDISINLLQPNIFPFKIFIALGAIQILFYLRHKHAHNDFHSIALSIVNTFHSSISKVLANKKLYQMFHVKHSF